MKFNNNFQDANQFVCKRWLHVCHGAIHPKYSIKKHIFWTILFIFICFEQKTQKFTRINQILPEFTRIHQNSIEFTRITRIHASNCWIFMNFGAPVKWMTSLWKQWKLIKNSLKKFIQIHKIHQKHSEWNPQIFVLVDIRIYLQPKYQLKIDSVCLYHFTSNYIYCYLSDSDKNSDIK